jgi:antitoxin HicB
MVPTGYYAVLYKVDDTIGVRIAEHPGVITYGYDWEHAAEMAKEALNAALEVDFERGDDLPVARKPKVKHDERVVFVPLDPEVRTAYLLRAWRKENSLTQKAIAKKIGISFQAYQRMERPGRANVTVATLDRVAVALGKELVIDLR